METMTKHTHTKLIAMIIAIALSICAVGAITATTAYADAPQAKAGSWVKSSGKWWYSYTDGTYPANTQVTIKGSTYSFDAKGWMKTGWKLEDGSWYYYKSSGAMATGWQKVKGTWYYLNSDGKMATSWKSVDGKWYYLKASGAIKTGWVQDGSDWYYTNKSGAMVTGWQKVGGKWYYLGSNGKMATGKATVAGKTYILAPSGAMKTGWAQVGSTWYYCDKSGAAKTNTWISGTYWVGSDGVMATNAWINDGKGTYYVDSAGKYVKNPSASQLATKPGNAGSSSSNNSSTNQDSTTNQVSNADQSSSTSHEHDWLLHKAETKFLTVCTGCDEVNPSRDHLKAHALKGEQSGTKQKYVTVKEAYYSCSCGATKAA